jgi:sporulation protein YlmC with PRC-barrel domain
MRAKTKLAAAVLAASGLAVTGVAAADAKVEYAHGLLFAQAQTQPAEPVQPGAEPPPTLTPGEPDVLVEEVGALETIRVGDLRGTRVQNTAGADIGRIEDVVLDRHGNVAYLALSYGGILGIGDKLFAVPWDEVQWVEGEPYVVVDLSRETLDRLEGFDQREWPQRPDFAAFEERRAIDAPEAPAVVPETAPAPVETR